MEAAVEVAAGDLLQPLTEKMSAINNKQEMMRFFMVSLLYPLLISVYHRPICLSIATVYWKNKYTKNTHAYLLLVHGEI